jgi:mono/diheme cytochrome c family protein
MNKKFIILIMVLGLFLIGLDGNLKAQEIDETKALFEQKCSQCHATSRALNKNKSLNGWQQTTQRMAKKSGSNISEQEAEKIAEYLFSLKEKDNN